MTEQAHTHHDRPPRALGGVIALACVLALIGCGIGVATQPAAFWAGWSVAAVYWTGVSLGSLGLALIHRTTGGAWGYAIGRSLQAAQGALPVGIVALATLLMLGAGHVYPWARPDAAEHVNPNQLQYLAPVAVAARWGLFAVIWLAFGVWLTQGLKRESRNPELIPSSRKAALGLCVFFVTVSFFAIDAMMSVAPTWASSLFPVIQIMSFGLTALALSLIVRWQTLRNQTGREINLTHDVGNLMQAANLLWTYMAFSQYLIIWAGDLPLEVAWFVERRTPLAGWTALALVLFHFVIPFILLLSRDVKRNPRRLAMVAGLLMTMSLIDNAWTMLPSIHVPIVPAVILMFCSWIGIGGIWLLVYRMNWNRLPDVAPADGEHHEPAHGSPAGGAA